MSSGRYTIMVEGTGIQDEAVANAAITPGQLVELLSTGKVQKVAAAGGKVEIAVAIEDYLQGNGINDDYAVGARVLHRIFCRGQQVLLILADGENVAIGDKLVAATGGEVKGQATSTEEVLVVAMEAVDASGGSVAVDDRRIVCRVL